MPQSSSRPILVAEIVSVGTEITVGETRDTNSGELARSLTESGVRVGRIVALPDQLEAVTAAVRDGLARADLVVTTGGLGPTPDDLTREAIAAACGETPTVDPELEAWLRGLWDRRGLPFLEINLKQAWRIPSATALRNAEGTAPGWLVARPDGRLVVALPGPPREMRPMWAEGALPALRERGLGADVARSTYRLTGIGESAVAALLGEELLRATNPVVATYARSDAVDVRVSAIGAGGRPAAELVAEAAAIVERRVGPYVWATGATTWAEAIAARLVEAGRTLATLEAATGGTLVHLLGSVPALVDSVVAPALTGALADRATDLLAASGADIVLAVRARPRGRDTAVSIVVVTGDGIRKASRVAFLGGQTGRDRAALGAAAFLLETLGGGVPSVPASAGRSGRARPGRG